MYDINDKIGRKDSKDIIRTSVVTAGSTPSLLAGAIFGRRSNIKVINMGAVDVSLVTTSGSSAADGYIIKASGGVFEDNTDGVLYIVSTGADSEVRVYERSSRFNYKR